MKRVFKIFYFPLRDLALDHMSRIDAGAPTDREALKNEIKDEIRREEGRKKLVHCTGCALLWLVVLAIPLVWGSVVLAKTGLVTIPVLTERLYRPSEPIRKVVPLAGSTVDDVMRSIAVGAKMDAKTRTLEFGLREAQLTTLVRNGLAGADAGLPFPMHDSQAAIEENGLEFFATTPRAGRDVTLKVRMVPSLVNGALRFDIEEARIGSYGLPKALARLASSLASKTIGDALGRAVAGIGVLTGIALEKGIIRLSVQPRGL